MTNTNDLQEEKRRRRREEMRGAEKN